MLITIFHGPHCTEDHLPRRAILILPLAALQNKTTPYRTVLDAVVHRRFFLFHGMRMDLGSAPTRFLEISRALTELFGHTSTSTLSRWREWATIVNVERHNRIERDGIIQCLFRLLSLLGMFRVRSHIVVHMWRT